MIETSVDLDARMAYVKLGDGEFSRTYEAHPRVMIDVDVDGKLIGVEIFL